MLIKLNLCCSEIKVYNYILCCNADFCLKIDGKVIERVKCSKFLGVIIDEDLSWKQHTTHISLKISKSIGIIYRVKSMLSCDLLKTLYYSLIHPYLQYCNIIWGTTSKLALYQLICLQKRAYQFLLSCFK